MKKIFFFFHPCARRTSKKGPKWSLCRDVKQKTFKKIESVKIDFIPTINLVAIKSQTQPYSFCFVYGKVCFILSFYFHLKI